MKEQNAYYKVQNWERIDNNERDLIKKNICSTQEGYYSIS